MSKFIIIGNIISLIAAVFTVSAAISKHRKQIYGFQTLECLTMAIASAFFLSFSGITTFLFNALRNALLVYDKFTKGLCILFLILLTTLGLIFNNLGLLGLMPVVTTVCYTLGTYLFHKDISIKLNSFVNLTLWAIYDFFILDYVTAIVDSIAAVCTIVATIIMCRTQNPS